MNIQSETMGYLREHYKRLPVSPHQLYTWYIANIVHVDSSSGVLRLDHPDKTNNITALCCISSLVSTRCPSFTIKFYWVFLINTICQHFLCVLLCIEWPPCGVWWRSVIQKYFSSTNTIPLLVCILETYVVIRHGILGCTVGNHMRRTGRARNVVFCVWEGVRFMRVAFL